MPVPETTAPEKSSKEIAAFSPEDKVRAEARAVEMALVLMQWVSLEGAVCSRGIGLRERFDKMRALRDLLDRAERLTQEIVA